MVILNKTGYLDKLENMVKEGIGKGKYTFTKDNTINDPKNLKQFLKRNFKGYNQLDDMLPTSNQQAKIYASTKTHKFSFVDSVDINESKFRPTIDQIGTMRYNAAIVISHYLRSLCKSK